MQIYSAKCANIIHNLYFGKHGDGDEDEDNGKYFFIYETATILAIVLIFGDCPNEGDAEWQTERVKE